PFLSKMSREQFIRLITVINDNSQIYNRSASYYTNTEIINFACNLSGDDLDFNQFPHFEFDSNNENINMIDTV
ncbi:MAG: hypothetical protein IKY83_01920, partial [Proteobacteria bacterium]|nr:hypothetical protein [Pseudomonadota bacterium]